MKGTIALFTVILLITIAMIGMGNADREEHESVYAGPYELHFYANHHLEFSIDDLSSGDVGKYKITGYYVGDPNGAKFQIGIINDPSKRQISQTRQQQKEKMMGLVESDSGYVIDGDDSAFLDDNHPAEIIRCTKGGSLAHEYIGIMLSGTEELFMDAPGPMETGLYDYDYAAVLESIQVIGHGTAQFDENNEGQNSDYTGTEGLPAEPSPSSTEAMPANLALHKFTSQSTTTANWGGNWSSSRGVDGVKNGNIWEGGFHTDNEENPWWQVDLGEAYQLREIRIYNRLDCCSERSRTLQVLLSDDAENWRVVYSHDGSVFGGADGNYLDIKLDNEMARFVQVQLREKNYLHLDEVEVYGE